MTEPSAPTRPNPFRGLARGAFIGAGLALFFIAIGVGRAILLLVLGRGINPVSPKELRELAFYVGGFAIAGALVGFSWQFLPGRLGKLLAFAAGGGIVMLAIAAGDKGFGRLDVIDWVAYPAMGAILGLVAGLSYMNRRRS